MSCPGDWLRFIDLGESAPDFDRLRQFVFFDLLDNRFVEFDGDRVWSSWPEFEYALRSCATSTDFPYRTKLTDETVAEFKSLCPDWVRGK